MELFEMGAAVMVAPSLTYIQKKYPGAQIFCLTTEKMVGAWQSLGLIPKDRIIVIRSRNAIDFLWSAVVKSVWLRRQRFDLCIDYELFLRLPVILSSIIGAKKRAGFYRYLVEGLYRGRIYDIPCSFNQNQHIAKNFLALTHTALAETSDYPNYKGSISNEELILPRHQTSESRVQALFAKLELLHPTASEKQLIVVSPDVGPNLTMRNYPEESFVEAIQKLLSAPRQRLVVLVGSQANRRIASNIQRSVGDSRCLNLCGETTFDELLDLLAISSVVVCNDNGIGHFAALTRTKTIALFSTDSPFMYGPLGPCTILYSFYHCSPCISAFNLKSSHCKDNRCLQAISPETLVDYVENAIQGRLFDRTINNSVPYIV